MVRNQDRRQRGKTAPVEKLTMLSLGLKAGRMFRSSPGPALLDSDVHHFRLKNTTEHLSFVQMKLCIEYDGP